MTTLFCGDVSRTQMYLSDSIVTCVNVMNCGLIPRLGRVRVSLAVMGALAAVWEGVEPDMAEEIGRCKPSERERRCRSESRGESCLCSGRGIERDLKQPWE